MEWQQTSVPLGYRERNNGRALVWAKVLRTMSKITLRCAIYTRKSTAEGLAQEFNSLDAQRAACGAFITSQVGQGWKELPKFYDDGGISGGTMERPALLDLLADIKAGKVDVVVVYKIDRHKVLLLHSCYQKSLGGFTFEVQQLLTEDFCRSFKFEAFARRVVVDLQTFIEV